MLPVNFIPPSMISPPVVYSGRISVSWQDTPIVEKPAIIEKCTCDIMSLMAQGCKCGQFAREQAKK